MVFAQDFFGPAFSVYILRPPGGSSVTLNPAFLESNAVDLAPILQSLEITQNLGELFQAVAVVSPPYELALELVKTDLINYGNLMLMQFGYPETGHLSPNLIAFTTYPAVVLDPIRSSITFTGTGAFHYSTKQITNRVWNPQDYPEGALSIVKEIVGIHRLNLRYVRLGPKASLLGLPPAARASLMATNPEFFAEGAQETPPAFLVDKTKWRFKIHQFDDDFTFVKRLLAHGNCDFLVDRNNLFIFDRDRLLDSSPVATFRMMSQVDVLTNEFPIISFSADQNFFFQEPEATLTTIRTGTDPTKKSVPTFENYDPKSGTSVVLRDRTSSGPEALPTTTFFVDQEEVAAAPGILGISSLVQNLLRTAHNEYMSPRDPLADRAKFRAKTAALRTLTATLRTPGNPGLAPGANITVVGVGRYDGNFQVQGVQHRLDQSGFITTLRLRSNALHEQTTPDTPSSEGGNINKSPARTTGLGSINALIRKLA